MQKYFAAGLYHGDPPQVEGGGGVVYLGVGMVPPSPEDSMGQQPGIHQHQQQAGLHHQQHQSLGTQAR